LKTISHTDEAAKKIVIKFCDQVFLLRNIRHIYRELFENDQMSILMQKTASSFFDDLNIILHQYLLLEFVKITDPAESQGKENFTVGNLIESIDWPEGIKLKLTPLNNKIESFRLLVKPARNRQLAHMDKETLLGDMKLGEFPEGEDELFLNALQKICDITHEICFGSIGAQRLMVKPGDVINLKRTLENAIAFKELLSETSGQEKTRLYSYLNKTKRWPISEQ